MQVQACLASCVGQLQCPAGHCQACSQLCCRPSVGWPACQAHSGQLVASRQHRSALAAQRNCPARALACPQDTMTSRAVPAHYVLLSAGIAKPHLQEAPGAQTWTGGLPRSGAACALSGCPGGGWCPGRLPWPPPPQARRWQASGLPAQRSRARSAHSLQAAPCCRRCRHAQPRVQQAGAGTGAGVCICSFSSCSRPEGHRRRVLWSEHMAPWSKPS